MENVQDRQDVPIWNAIEAKNYKQALKLVDKRLSKRATDYLEVCTLNDLWKVIDSKSWLG